jgi:hypothetical protein
VFNVVEDGNKHGIFSNSVRGRVGIAVGTVMNNAIHIKLVVDLESVSNLFGPSLCHDTDPF